MGINMSNVVVSASSLKAHGGKSLYGPLESRNFAFRQF